MPEQFGPRLPRLPVAVGESRKLFGPARTSADLGWTARTIVMAETNAGVDAVHPDADVVRHREIAAHEAPSLGLPPFGETGDRRGGQTGLGAEEPFGGGHEVPAGETVEAE